MKQKHEIDIENVEQLLVAHSSKSMLIKALSIFLPNKISFYVIVLLCLLPSILISISIDTISLTLSSIEIINQIIIALLGIVFTGYAFFQALINKELLIWMLGSDESKSQVKKKKSRLQITNEYFVEIMILQGLSIFVGLFINVSLNAIPNNWYIFDNYIVNNSLAFLMLWIYFSFNFLIVWEIKSFVFNLFQLFNLHAGAKVLSMLEDNDDEE